MPDDANPFGFVPAGINFSSGETGSGFGMSESMFKFLKSSPFASDKYYSSGNGVESGLSAVNTPSPYPVPGVQGNESASAGVTPSGNALTPPSASPNASSVGNPNEPAQSGSNFSFMNPATWPDAIMSFLRSAGKNILWMLIALALLFVGIKVLASNSTAKG